MEHSFKSNNLSQKIVLIISLLCSIFRQIASCGVTPLLVMFSKIEVLIASAVLKYVGGSN